MVLLSRKLQLRTCDVHCQAGLLAPRSDELVVAHPSSRVPRRPGGGLLCVADAVRDRRLPARDS